MGKKNWTWAAVLALAACTPIESGTLGNGKFGYVCMGQFPNDASNFDAACAPGILAMGNTVPAQVAVGATFTVTYKSNATTGEEPTFSAAPSIVALSGGHFEALRPGVVAIIGTHKGNADDLLYVKVAKIASIKIVQSGTGSLEATPLSSDNATLGGKLACDWQWSTTNSAVQVQSVGRKATVTGLPGQSAQVFAKCGDVGESIVITIKGQSQDGGGGSDAASDAPSDSGNDAAKDGGSDA